MPVAFLSFSFYDLMQFLSKSVKVASSWKLLGRKVAAVTFYVCESLSKNVSIYDIYIYMCV